MEFFVLKLLVGKYLGDLTDLQIGLNSNSDWVKEDIKLSQYGEIEINDHGETSMQGVFAAGDVTTIPYKQIIIAMGEGSKAALGAFDHLIRH